MSAAREAPPQAASPAVNDLLGQAAQEGRRMDPLSPGLQGGLPLGCTRLPLSSGCPEETRRFGEGSGLKYCARIGPTDDVP